MELSNKQSSDNPQNAVRNIEEEPDRRKAQPETSVSEENDFTPLRGRVDPVSPLDAACTSTTESEVRAGKHYRLHDARTDNVTVQTGSTGYHIDTRENLVTTQKLVELHRMDKKTVFVIVDWDNIPYIFTTTGVISQINPEANDQIFFWLCGREDLSDKCKDIVKQVVETLPQRNFVIEKAEKIKNGSDIRIIKRVTELSMILSTNSCIFLIISGDKSFQAISNNFFDSRVKIIDPKANDACIWNTVMNSKPSVSSLDSIIGGIWIKKLNNIIMIVIHSRPEDVPREFKKCLEKWFKQNSIAILFCNDKQKDKPRTNWYDDFVKNEQLFILKSSARLKDGSVFQTVCATLVMHTRLPIGISFTIIVSLESDTMLLEKSVVCCNGRIIRIEDIKSIKHTTIDQHL